MAARQKSAVAEDVPVAALVADGDALDAAGRYVGQWNRLVSTTNWEKGRIICQWRDALVAAGAAVTEYSDEAWSQLVGGVTSQHVGRLRRVYQRFGDAHDQFEGLYWSHFQASLDWEDAEMWLEGAIHNGWSVSQMRGKRWETLGKPGEVPPTEEGSELDESDADGSVDAPFDADGSLEHATFATPNAAKPVEPAAPQERTGEASEESEEKSASRSSVEADDYEAPKSPAKSRQRLSVEVDELPEDLADAFEQFKLAIIAQRRLGWSETTPEAVLECLDALRELTLAPADN